MNKYFLLIISVYLFASSAFATGENQQSGGRSAAMGNASVALYDNWSTFNNQAGIAYLDSYHLGLNYNSEFALSELSFKSLAFVAPTGFGNFGISVSNFGYSLYSESKFGLAFAKKLNKRFAMAVQMDYLYINATEKYGSKGIAIGEIGILSEPMDHLYVGAHIYNPWRTKVSDYNDERVPTVVRFGLAYEFSDKAIASAEAEKDFDYSTNFKAGVEYRIVEYLYARAGISTNPTNKYSFGLGYKLKGFTADFSFTHHYVLGFTPHVSLNYFFGKKNNEENN